MELKKLLTIFVVFLAVLAAMSTIIEAQRGGMGGGHGSGMGGHGGGMGGGHHWSVNAGNDNNNVGDNNNAGIEVYVSTDKRMYVLGEPIEITVTAYNPTGYAVGVEYECTVLKYIIDGYIGPYTYVDENGTDISWDIRGGGPAGGCPSGAHVLQPHETITETFVREGGTGGAYGKYVYVPLPVGRHSVVGTVGDGNSQYKSRPITIRVVE